MNKSLLIVVTALTTMGLLNFGIKSWGKQATSTCSQVIDLNRMCQSANVQEPDIDLVYKVEPRFRTTVTKDQLEQAQSIVDILPTEATQSIESYPYVQVTIWEEEENPSEVGDSHLLNAAQLELLRTADYSTNFYISSRVHRKNAYTGKTYEDTLIYYMTIVPEQEAEYASGYDALITYLKENSWEQTRIIRRAGLQPGKVSFSVTKEGTVENVQLNTTSGYPTVDESLLKIVGNMPGKWNPATNAKGEKVEQELIFFFGLEGC